MDEVTLAVVGITFPNADGSSRLFELLLCRPGDPVTLRPEPRNRHDPLAIAVLSARGHQIGYIAAERAGWVGRRMAAHGCTAIFQGRTESAGYVRAAFGDRQPSLPPVRPLVPPGAHTFLPEPDSPDWGA